MSRPVVCYLERAAGGSLIARVRLVADGGPGGVDRSWTAPSLPVRAPGSPEQSSPERAGEALNQTRAAARWVADCLTTLGTRRLAALCVDTDGAVCTWLSAPSADPAMIQATLMQPDTDGDAGGGGGGAARLLALGAGSPGGFTPGDATVQALAGVRAPSSGGGRGLLARRAGEDGARQRFAVMAVPDAPVRVFLDELDARGIEVDQVMSLWHALCAAWDPSTDADGPADDHDPLNGRVVSSQTPGAAVIAVDPPPSGRLVWAWSQAGQLVAGGTMRLRQVHAAPAAAAGDELAEPGAARRVGAEARAPEAALEFTQAEAGRLVLDWLSWSAQLGRCPQRVAVIGPAPIPGEGPAGPDPGLIGRSLGQAWPGAAVGVAVHDDPIGATLKRLLTRDLAQASRRAAELDVASGSDDPRASLVALSARPGRADRRMHTWVALGVAAVALVVGAVGYKLGAEARGAEAAVAKAAAAKREAMESLTPTMPQITASTKLSELEAEVSQLEKQNKSIKPPRPMLQETAALLRAIAEQTAIVRDAHDNAEIRIERFDLNPITGVVNLRVPDAESGPAILVKLQQTPNLFMKWSGSTPGGPAGNASGERRYNLQGLEAGDRTPGGGGS